MEMLKIKNKTRGVRDGTEISNVTEIKLKGEHNSGPIVDENMDKVFEEVLDTELSSEEEELSWRRTKLQHDINMKNL